MDFVLGFYIDLLVLFKDGCVDVIIGFDVKMWCGVVFVLLFCFEIFVVLFVDYVLCNKKWLDVKDFMD